MTRASIPSLSPSPSGEIVRAEAGVEALFLSNQLHVKVGHSCEQNDGLLLLKTCPFRTIVGRDTCV